MQELNRISFPLLLLHGESHLCDRSFCGRDMSMGENILCLLVQKLPEEGGRLDGPGQVAGAAEQVHDSSITSRRRASRD